jgi:hypothetical protein
MIELPYFKFFPNQWLTGTISFMELDLQGAYIRACCYYWSKNCEVPLEQLKIIIPKHYQQLIDLKLFKIVKGQIKIKFLDEQYEQFKKRSKINAANGSKGGKAKANATKSLSINKRKDNKIKDNYANDNLLRVSDDVKKLLAND